MMPATTALWPVSERALGRRSGGVRAEPAAQHLQHDLRVQVRRRGGDVLHHFLFPLRRQHVDDADEVMVRGDDGGGLRGEHRRAVRRVMRGDDVAGELADRDHVARDGQEARLRRLVGRPAAIEDRRGRSTPQVVLPPDRVGDLADPAAPG
jgi:hypothetical protein